MSALGFARGLIFFFCRGGRGAAACARAKRFYAAAQSGRKPFGAAGSVRYVMSKKEKKKKDNRTYIGGQAVLEGVMMRGKTAYATAVRDPEGNIQVESRRLNPSKHMRRIAKIPLLRGVVNLVSSLVTGSRILMRSAEVYGDEGEPGKFEKWCEKKLHINLMSVITTLATVLGVLLALGLFIVLPIVFANLLAGTGVPWLAKYTICYNLFQGLCRLIIFVLYIVAVTAMKDIRRVFMYHGAEHKTISCFERGLPMTPENAKTCSRIHDRCGTTFLFLVVFISIVVYCFVNWLFAGVYFGIGNSVLEFIVQLLVKLCFLPLIAGISYEVLKLLAKSQSKWLLPIKAPGFALQKLTTREPDEAQLEVAIAAFKRVYEMDADPSLPETDFVVSKSVHKYTEELAALFEERGIDRSDAEWLVSLQTGIARSELSASDAVLVPGKVRALDALAAQRLAGKPLWYILGSANFCGYEIKTDARALIPRPETEMLASLAANTCEAGDKVLDLCTGSGCIAVAVSKMAAGKNISVTAADISADALALARENAKENGADIRFIESDLFANVKGKFNVIVCNPPYVKRGDLASLQREVREHEPMLALDGGEDGLDFYRRIAKDAPRRLAAGGTLLLECGQGQAQEIVRLLAKFEYTMVLRDLQGVERYIRAVL